MSFQRQNTAGRHHVKVLSAILLSAGLTLTAPSAQAEWRRAETANFIVYGEGSEADLRPHAEKLERFDAVLRRQFNRPALEGVRKLPVYLLHTRRDLAEVFPAVAEGKAAGFYSASEIDVYAALNRRSGDDLLFHEYAHHFMYQNFPGFYPGWFVEGFAEFFMTAQVNDPQRVELGGFNPGRIYTLNQSRWLAIEDLLSKRPRDFSQREQRGVFYAQSWLLTHYLLADAERRQGLDAYLADVGRGVAPVEALQNRLGHTPESLTAALRAYLRGEMKYVRFSMTDTQPSVQIETLPPSADRMLLYSLRSRYPQSPEDAAALLERTRADAARYPQDRLALVTLGRAELQWGDTTAGEAALNSALTVAPEDAEALRLLADARLKASDEKQDPAERARLVREARGYLARALDADPTDYRIFAALARSRRDAVDYPNANDLETWRLAVAFAPQVMRLRLEAAEAMTKGGEVEEAAELLAVVANSPHEAGADRDEVPD
ncbi:tetratricopeptide repeat protein [Brevundimonas diminuta]|uniref:tetratricopeptide repeat protein n=1 Tax=Brevundimonas diminuta TaxID=293 RepID=UPI0032093215